MGRKMEKKMKNIAVLLVIAFLLSACAEAPGIEYSSLPEDFNVLKAKESSNVFYADEEDINIETPEIEYPSGNYILLTNISSNLFKLSYYSDNKEVCSWSNEITHPSTFKEKEILYIVEENCPGMGDRVITWDLSLNEAKMDGANIDIWTNVGSDYFSD